MSRKPVRIGGEQASLKGRVLRLGANLPEVFEGPWEWARAQSANGFSAASLPLAAPVDEDVVEAYVTTAGAFGVQIAEVGAWSNPLSRDPTEAKASQERCQQQLALAEQAGARCCVNIAGSLGPKWDGPFAQDLEEDTFALVVDSVREIIDGVRPKRTFYTLETMPWLFPDSVDHYERLLRAVDRPAFAVHFDPVNLVSSPGVYFRNGAMIREFVRRLGARMRSCHAKDIRLGERLTVHLDEVRPGTGALDYRALVTSLQACDPEMPLLIEHLSDTREYLLAAEHIRSVCHEVSVDVIAPAEEGELLWDAQ